MSEQQYKLQVENGNIISEEGAFFKAAPFSIQADGTSFSLKLIHTPEHEVVYELKSGDTVVAQLEHPDYTPDHDPSEESNMALYAALIQLQVAKGKPYKAALETENNHSYTVVQNQFL